MSPSEVALARGFAARERASGEMVTLERGDIKIPQLLVVIDRAPFEREQRRNTVDFESREASVVEVGTSRLAAKPHTGESFLDEFGYRHRIKKVSPKGSRYLCMCEVSEA